jgi:Nucleoside diphosphate kinase
MSRLDPLPSSADWRQLTASPEKRREYAEDLYFRECWAEMVRVFGSRAAGVLQSIAVMNVKPDAVVGRRMRDVLHFAVRHGFLPIGAAPLQLTRHSMRELWRYDWCVYPVDRLAFSTLWYTASEVLLYIFQDLAHDAGHPAASLRLSGMKGDAIAERRRAGDLRTLLRPPNRVLNFVHVADEPADVVRELGIFFDRTELRALIGDIAANLGTDRRSAVECWIDRLEARYAEHDLDVVLSIGRLEASELLTSASACRLRALIGAGEKLAWDELCALLDPTAGVDRWDFLCVASSVIHYERDRAAALLSSEATG